MANGYLERSTTQPAVGDRFAAIPPDAFFAAVVESSEDAILATTLDGEITAWSPAAQRLYGFSECEALGRSIDLVAPEDRRAEIASILERVRRGERLARFETIQRHKDGHPLSVSLTAAPIRSPEGAVVGISKIVRDLTAYREAEEHFRSAVEASPCGMAMVDGSGRILLVNRRIEQMFGYDRESLIGRSVGILVPESAREAHDVLRAEYVKHPETRLMGAGRELVGRRKDGSEFPVEIGLDTLTTSQGLRVIAAVADISDRRRAEERLRSYATRLERAREMARTTSEQLAHETAVFSRRRGELEEELEDMFAIVAHDLKRPVVALDGLLTMLARAGSSSEIPTGEYVARALAQCQRMRRMLEDLSSLSATTRRECALEEVELESWLEAIVARYRGIADERGVQMSCACEGGRVRLARSALEESCVNLLENALKYGCGGTQPRVGVACRVDGGVLELSVEDSGKGIAPADQHKVFEPFRRLDPEMAEGSGVGLVSVRRLMARHGGSIALESDVDRGARFLVYLPVEPCPPADPAA